MKTGKKPDRKCLKSFRPVTLNTVMRFAVLYKYAECLHVPILNSVMGCHVGLFSAATCFCFHTVSAATCAPQCKLGIRGLGICANARLSALLFSKHMQNFYMYLYILMWNDRMK